MTPLMNDPTVQDLVRRLREAFDPCTIRLFGSRATGSHGPDSDFDVMVVIPETEETHFERFKRGCQALRGLGVPIDLLVYTEEEWVWTSNKINSVAREVKDKGVILHAA